MPTTTTLPQRERRKFVRNEPLARFGVAVLRPDRTVSADSLNVSEGGLCLRLREMLEVRSLVRLQLTPPSLRRVVSPSHATGTGRRMVECTGRVTWVIQRLDLRTAPPFLFDVGVEFVDPPPTLRRLMAQRSGEVSTLKLGANRFTPPSMIRGRHFVPRVERAAGQGLRWHLVVSVDGVPCFSRRYPSERAALVGWEQFKRHEARRTR